MRMQRTICGKTLRGGISYKTINELTDVEKIKNFLREQKLRWLDHKKKMDDERAPVKAKNFGSKTGNGSKRGRQKKRIKRDYKKHILSRGLKRNNAQDHALWRLDCKSRPTPTR